LLKELNFGNICKILIWAEIKTTMKNFTMSLCVYLFFILTSCAATQKAPADPFKTLEPEDQIAGKGSAAAKKIETGKWADGTPKEYTYISIDGKTVYAVENINPDGKSFIEGKIPNGQILQYYGDMVAAQLNYNNGILEGVIKEYFSNGTISATRNYKSGRLYGPVREYYPNGKIKEEASYKDNVLDGVVRKYSETGNILLLQEYRDGELSGLCRDYYANGKIHTEKEYFNGKKNGICRQYAPNGVLLNEQRYSKDILDGESLEYYAGGNIQSVMNYSDGKLEGVSKIYGENNSSIPLYIDTYSNGRKIQRRAYDSTGALVFTLNY
jgi:antitoxin component YwqK of YwqJK toxin-antitoxin module